MVLEIYYVKFLKTTKLFAIIIIYNMHGPFYGLVMGSISHPGKSNIFPWFMVYLTFVFLCIILQGFQFVTFISYLKNHHLKGPSLKLCN